MGALPTIKCTPPNATRIKSGTATARHWESVRTGLRLPTILNGFSKREEHYLN